MLTIFSPLIEWIPGADRPDTFRPQDKEAMGCLAAGRTAKAIRLYKRTLADCERTLGADHPYTFRSRNNLAMGYRAAGRTAERDPGTSSPIFSVDDLRSSIGAGAGAARPAGTRLITNIAP